MTNKVLKLVDKLFCPPTESQNDPDIVDIYECFASQNPFKTPTIVMSDMYIHNQVVIEYLNQNYNLADFNMINTGNRTSKIDDISPGEFFCVILW